MTVNVYRYCMVGVFFVLFFNFGTLKAAVCAEQRDHLEAGFTHLFTKTLSGFGDKQLKC